MTTQAVCLSRQDDIRLPMQAGEEFSWLEGDSLLLEPEQLRARLEILDALDAGFGDLDSVRRETSRGIRHRAQAIRTRLEAINAELYQAIRYEIVHGAQGSGVLRWMEASASREERESAAPGPGYDWRDEVLSGILHLREPSEASVHRADEMVFYQPTPVRYILRLIVASALSAVDVFVDLGSGLGHVPLLASMLTGAKSLGIEVEAAYIASAQECAQRLQLSRVRFLHEDARAADLSAGTVFYLYSPFTGSMLAEVLGRLRKQSASRPIRICTLGACACTVAQESWLMARARPDPDQITVFQTSL